MHRAIRGRTFRCPAGIEPRKALSGETVCLISLAVTHNHHPFPPDRMLMTIPGAAN